MRAFANLLDRLAFTPQRNGKLTLLRDFMRDTADPERGWALAALTGELVFGDVLTLRLVVGDALTMAGVGLVALSERRRMKLADALATPT